MIRRRDDLAFDGETEDSPDEPQEQREDLERLRFSLSGAPPDHVLERMRRVLEIVPGERPLLPQFGCRIHFLSSLATREDRLLAAALVEEALERWLPELRVDRAEVLGSYDGLIRLALLTGGTWYGLEIKHRHPSRARSAEGEEPDVSARSGAAARDKEREGLEP